MTGLCELLTNKCRQTSNQQGTATPFLALANDVEALQ
jgi:hypothetical protein